MAIDHIMMAWIKEVGEESFDAFFISSDSKESELMSTLNCESRMAAEFWIRSRAESLELPIEWISGPS